MESDLVAAEPGDDRIVDELACPLRSPTLQVLDATVVLLLRRGISGQFVKVDVAVDDLRLDADVRLVTGDVGRAALVGGHGRPCTTAMIVPSFDARSATSCTSPRRRLRAMSRRLCFSEVSAGKASSA